MDLQRSRSNRVAGLVEEEEEEKKRLLEKEREDNVIRKLISPCLEEVGYALKERRFKREVWVSCQAQLARIALFRLL